MADAPSIPPPPVPAFDQLPTPALIIIHARLAKTLTEIEFLISARAVAN